MEDVLERDRWPARVRDPVWLLFRVVRFAAPGHCGVVSLSDDLPVSVTLLKIHKGGFVHVQVFYAGTMTVLCVYLALARIAKAGPIADDDSV